MIRLLFLLCCIPVCFFSQSIRVVNAYTQEKIEGVKVIDTQNQQTWITNQKGEISIDLKKRKSNFLLQHKNYEVLKVRSLEIHKPLLLIPKYEDLESIVLSVSRVAEKKQRIPEQIEIITKKNIEYLSPQTSADLLANTSGVRVQKSQLGGGSPVIRGMESNRVLLVVDGVRMNNAIYRNGHLQNTITVSPFAIERAEVVFGPASVSYGSDALGGVIHYYTKGLNYSTNLRNKSDVFYRHSTVNKEQTIAISSFTSHKKWASFTNISFSDFKDLKMGSNRSHGYNNWGKVFRYSKNREGNYEEFSHKNSNTNLQKNTGYHQFDVLQKIKIPINQNIDLVINGQYSQSGNIPNFGKLNDQKKGELKFAEWYYGPQKRVLLSAQAKFDNYKSIFQDGTITLAYQKIKESRINRQFTSLNRNSRFEKVHVFSLNSDFYKSLTKKGNRKLFYGMEFVHNDVDSKAQGQTINSLGTVVGSFQLDTRYPDGGSTYSSGAVYSSYRQHLDKKNTLNVGLRLTTTVLSAGWNNNKEIKIPNNSITLQNTALTGSLGYIYKPKKNHKISIVLAKGFRAPNVDDVGKIREKSGKLTVPNTKLKSEKLYSTEVGYANFNKKKRVNFNVNVYYTLLDDYIARAPSSEFGSQVTYDGDRFDDNAILANTNQGQAYIYGGSASVFLKLLNNLKSNASITYTKGSSYDTKQPLSSIPPLFGNLSIGMFKPKFDVALNYSLSLAKKLKDYNQLEGIDNLDETPNNQGTPFWQVFGLNYNYYISEKFKVQLQLQNIFDVHYKEFASSLSAPGRNLMVATAYSF